MADLPVYHALVGRQQHTNYQVNYGTLFPFLVGALAADSVSFHQTLSSIIDLQLSSCGVCWWCTLVRYTGLVVLVAHAHHYGWACVQVG